MERVPVSLPMEKYPIIINLLCVLFYMVKIQGSDDFVCGASASQTFGCSVGSILTLS